MCIIRRQRQQGNEPGSARSTSNTFPRKRHNVRSVDNHGVSAETYTGATSGIGTALEQVLVYSDSASWGVDGIHLDADQHERLGRALAAFVDGLPGFSPATS